MSVKPDRRSFLVQKTFGGDGFDMAVDQVTELEKQLGIYTLAQFTPK
jgi:hypothetical protein